MIASSFTFFLFSSEKKSIMQSAVVESKLSNSLKKEEWEVLFKEFEKLNLLFNGSNCTFHFKGLIEELTWFCHQVNSVSNLRYDNSDVFDPRQISPFLKYAPSLYEIADYNEAVHEFLPPLATSIVEIRNILREINGDTGFFGVFRQTTRQKLKEAIGEFALQYNNFYNANETMKKIHECLSNPKE